ncbi:peptidyl-prolyl cis-trans isomerase FKBP17-1, chloroplastic isoform X2 [Hevea brasiliensis]|uniref:peptidyl-prolyl cis-trans isomerase FKBP17-1, chloroplastic isoform X2 n=1 Tax=Hevea brasiliensis TaxID=3981 RepID=UPI0025D8C315|nr:peptidyl-prolyl cis-trans isomerase FKBP17-1, chloroplastic isoform X2 [Hevea brasiliensis]
MALNYFAPTVSIQATHYRAVPLPASPSSPEPLQATRRRLLSNATLISICAAFSISTIPIPFSAAASSRNELLEIPDSGGVKALDLRIGSGEVPLDGDQVAIHYYGRLAAKQGWRFDSTYDHKDDTNEPIPFVFVLGSGKVISGIEVAVKSMKVGGIRRVIIPPSQGYQNTTQEPIPPNLGQEPALRVNLPNCPSPVQLGLQIIPYFFQLFDLII